MAGKSPQPSHEPPFQAPVTLMKQWKGEKNKGWEGGKTLNEPLQCTLDDKLSDRSSVQSYHIPREPALMGLTAGFPLSLGRLSTKLTNRLTAKLTNCLTAKFADCLTAKLVNHLTAKFVNRLTAKLMNRLTAKLMNRLTARLVDRLTGKLMVVNLVKLHLIKLKLSEIVACLVILSILNIYSTPKL